MTSRDHSPFFNSRIDYPTTWKRSADTLMRSARAVWTEFERCEQIQREISIADIRAPGRNVAGTRTIDDPRAIDAFQGVWTFEVYLMLVGMAIENLLKATLLTVDKEKYVIRGESKISFHPSFATHELDKLAVEAKIFGKLTAEQKLLLRYLSIHVIWKGRYPIPSEPNKLNSFEFGGQSDAAFGFSIDLGMKEKCEALYLMFEQEIGRSK